MKTFVVYNMEKEEVKRGSFLACIAYVMSKVREFGLPTFANKGFGVMGTKAHAEWHKGYTSFVNAVTLGAVVYGEERYDEYYGEYTRSVEDMYTIAKV